MSLTFGKESEMPPEEKLKAAAEKAAQEDAVKKAAEAAAAKSIPHTRGCEPYAHSHYRRRRVSWPAVRMSLAHAGYAIKFYAGVKTRLTSHKIARKLVLPPARVGKWTRINP